MICNYANSKFLKWPHAPEKDPATSRKFSSSHLICESDSEFWMKYLSVHYRKRKKQVKCSIGGYENVHIFVIMRVCNKGVFFSHFCMHFVGELALVHNGRVSVIARCPQGKSLYVAFPMSKIP